MWPLERPAHTAEATYTTCISRVRNPGLALRLGAATDSVVTASNEFDQAAQSGTLHQVEEHEIVAPDVTAQEMEKVYTQRMAKVSAPGRSIYNDIFLSAPQGRCPYCMQRSVGTLDHHLPKARFPALSVAPLNLVPACSDCNKAKLDAVPLSPEDVALHPYYDDLGDEIWLRAQVVEGQPSALRFGVAPPDTWDETLSARVRNHFRRLGLAALYASEAAEELLNVRHQLVVLRAANPASGVRDELARRAESCSVARPNGWRSAAYRAWAASDWFCQNGFALR